MDIELLYQELTNKIDGLKNELDNCERQKEVISIIMSLKPIESLEEGYHSVTTDMNISREGINDFINLLSPNEYLKGHSSGGNGFFNSPLKEHKFDYYYLTLGIGIGLELKFCETKGFPEDIKETSLSISAYIDSQDLGIIVALEKSGWARIQIFDQDDCVNFESNTITEYLRFNNRRLNEVLTPISTEDLFSRFLDGLQVQDDVMKKQKK